MRKATTYFSLILLIVCALLCPSCSCSHRDEKEKQDSFDLYRYRAGVNAAIEGCLGTCLTREEMAQLVYNFEKIQSKWSNIPIGDTGDKVPDLKLDTPGEHYHDDNTRYEITSLPTDGNGICTGIKVSVMEDGACKIPDGTQEPAGDDTATTTKPDVPGTTTDTQQDDQQAGYWKLNEKRTYIKMAYPHSDTGWDYSYSASDLKHVYKAYLPANDYHEASDTTFTATCSEPPAVIKPEDKVTFTLDLDMQHSGGMLVGAYSYVAYGLPEADGRGIKYNGTKFKADEEDKPDSCNIDTLYNSNIPHVVVSHTFSNVGTPGSEQAIAFYGCDSMTLWIYEWVE